MEPVMLLFTVWVSFAEPGHLYAETRVCVRSESAAMAREHGEKVVQRILRKDLHAKAERVVGGCPWMPED